MESQWKNLRRKIKNLIYQENFNNNIKTRMRSLSNIFTRISDARVRHIWIKDSINEYDAFLDRVSQNTYLRNLIDEDLSRIEEKVIDLITSGLEIPSYEGQSFYLEAKRELGINFSLEKLLPKYLTFYLKKKVFKNNIIHKGDADPELELIFNYFNIPFNEFVRKLAESYLCNTDKNYLVNRLEDFFPLFFGSNDNYKFYVKAARILEYMKFQNISPVGTPFNYKITLSNFNTDYRGNNRVFNEGDFLDCHGLGFNRERCRNDGLVLFGRHPNADIVFPSDDYSIDLLACIIINSNDDIYMVDVSKASQCGIKLEFQKKYPLHEGQLINLAKTFTFYVQEIKMEDQISNLNNSNVVTVPIVIDESPQDSCISLFCVEGIYIGKTYNCTTKSMNHNEKKNVHIFGVGGNNIEVDVYFPPGYGVSRDHFRLEFELNQNIWNIIDYKSTKGTFFLLKNFDQFQQKKHSGYKRVFEEISTDKCKTLLIGNYFFLAAPT